MNKNDKRQDGEENAAGVTERTDLGREEGCHGQRSVMKMFPFFIIKY